MGVVTPLNNPGGPEGDTVTVAEKLLNTEYLGNSRMNFCLLSRAANVRAQAYAHGHVCVRARA